MNLGYELSNFYGKSEEKKGSFYFKNSIVESVISNSQMSEKRNSDIKKSLMKLNENDFDKPSIEIESYTPSVKNLEKTKTSPKLNEYNEKNENMNQISLLKPSHFSSKENDKNINVTSFKLDENDEDFNQSFLKKQSAAQSRSFARDSKTKSYNVSNINFYNHINNTIILDSSNFMDTYFFNNENINVENFSQNFYIEENQRIIKKMGEESQIRAMSDNPNDNYQIFKKLIIFTKKLYAENLLIVKELLKKTLDKFDGYFELISIKIPGYEINSDGIIEYKIELFDKLLNKSWNFNSRYSKLRRLHLETKFSLALEGKNIKISDFPQRKFFGNKSKEFIEQRKWKLQTYFDNYLKNKNANSIMEKGILRYFFYREIWAEIEKSYLKRLKELDIIKNERNIGETPILIKINEIFEEIKKNLSLLDKNEAVIFIYYQNKFKSMDYKESLKIKN